MIAEFDMQNNRVNRIQTEITKGLTFQRAETNNVQIPEDVTEFKSDHDEIERQTSEQNMAFNEVEDDESDTELRADKNVNTDNQSKRT